MQCGPPHSHGFYQQGMLVLILSHATLQVSFAGLKGYELPGFNSPCLPQQCVSESTNGTLLVQSVKTLFGFLAVLETPEAKCQPSVVRNLKLKI